MEFYNYKKFSFAQETIFTVFTFFLTDKSSFLLPSTLSDKKYNYFRKGILQESQKQPSVDQRSQYWRPSAYYCLCNLQQSNTIQLRKIFSVMKKILKRHRRTAL